MKILYPAENTISNLSLEEQMKLAKDAGFDGIDYTPKAREIFFHPREILTLSLKHRMPIIGVHVPLLLILKTPINLYQRLFKYVSQFPDCKIFNLHLSGFITPLHHKSDNLKKFISFSQKKKIAVSLESNPNGYIIFKHFPKETYQPQHFGEYCIRNNLPINLDTSHVSSWGYDIIEFFNKHHQNINMIHLSDFDGKTQHLPFGKGKLPLTTLIKELNRKNYTGNMVFEIQKFSPNATVRAKINLLQESISLFRSHFRNN